MSLLLLGPIVLRKQDIILPANDGSNRPVVSDSNGLAERRRDQLWPRSCANKEASLSPQKDVHPILTSATMHVINGIGPGWQRTHAAVAHAKHPAATFRDLFDRKAIGRNVGIAQV